MKVALLMPAFLIAAAPAGASGVDWSQAQHVQVDVTSYAFRPNPIHLSAGLPVVLELTNRSPMDHDFTARKFFESAAVREEDRRMAAGGTVDLRPHRTVEVALVPKAGHYPLKCTHEFHETMGMKGEIVVE